MAFDINRMAAAALETAVNGDQHPRRRLSGLRALAAGAAIAGLARVALKRGPEIAPVDRLEEFAEGLRDRFAERGWIEEPEEEEDRFYDDEDFDEEDDDEDFEDDDDGGDDEGDDYDVEDEAEPADEDEDEEPDEDEPDEDEEAEEDEPDDEDFQEEDDEPEQEEESAPPLARRRSHGSNGVDPAERPPEPPEDRKKSKAGKS